MVAPGLDVIIRVHDPARLDELDRAVFSAALADYRPLAVHVMCQRFGPDALAAVQAILSAISAIVPEVAMAVLNRPDPVPADARAALLNLGLAAARGRYAAFLDYDDLIYPEGHRMLIAELEASGAAIAFGGILNTDVSRKGLVPLTLRKRRVFGGDGLRQLLHDNFCPLHSFVIDRSRVAPADLLIDESFTALEDYDLLLRLCAQHRSSFRLKDTIIGEYLFKDDGSNGNPLAPGGGMAARWVEAVRLIDARKARLVLSAPVQAELGVNEPGLTVASFLAGPPNPV